MSQNVLPPFDPLDYENIARNVVAALLERPLSPLPPAEPFGGAGIYGIYYAGQFHAYRQVASPPGDWPIYVGKAVPPGGRRGEGNATEGLGQPLFRRLQEHADSIRAATNLTLADFTCRHLTVQPVWIGLAENVLIRRFRPVWNTVMDGFGNHPPGRGRLAMRRPRWDIIHPGRAWAERLTARETPEQILRQVAEHLAGGVDN